MKSTSHTKIFDLAVPVVERFPLFSPEGEKLWVPGWDYRDSMGTTDITEDYEEFIGEWQALLTKQFGHRTGA